MSRKKVLMPCLGVRDLNLAQSHEESLYRKYFEARLRPPIFVEPLEGLRVNDGEKIIGKKLLMALIILVELERPKIFRLRVVSVILLRSRACVW